MKLTRDEFEAMIDKYEPNVILPDGGDMVLTKDQCLNWFASRCNLSAPSFVFVTEERYLWIAEKPQGNQKVFRIGGES